MSGKIGDVQEMERDAWNKEKSGAQKPVRGAFLQFVIKYKILIIVAVALIVIAALVAIVVTETTKKREVQERTCTALHESYEIETADTGVIHKYSSFAVAADSAYCSTVGKNIIKKGGSAVDTAIATGLCNGIMNFQSMGIGGGHFMLIYLKSKNKYYGINAREKAPLNADVFMFNTTSSTEGGLATAIPGEIKGYYEAYKLDHNLEWRELFQPTIDLCENGFKISRSLASALSQYTTKILNNPPLARVFIDPATNKTYKENDTVRMPDLARTFRKISENPDDFYNGQMAEDMVYEINQNGGNVTLEDFKSYKADVLEVEGLELKDGYKVYTLPPPSSGMLISFIINVMKGFEFPPDSQMNNQSLTVFYHRLIETFKHAYSKRTYLGDALFVNVTKYVAELTSQSHADYVRKLINDKKVFPQSYYGGSVFREDHGTAHISVLHPSGDAVGLTSTINLFFGAKYAGERTGIVYNDLMDDFSTPGQDNYFGFPASEANFIQPGKRPMSSMSPIIVVDKDQNVRLVLGASGGSKIISSVSQVATRTLWTNKPVYEAINERRVHHQLYPFDLEIEKGFSPIIQSNLEELGHSSKCFNYGGSTVQGIEVRPEGIFAQSDPRKGGLPDGE